MSTPPGPLTRRDLRKSDDPAPGAPARHAKTLRSHRVARAVGLVVVSATALGVGLVGFTFLRLRSNVTVLPSVTELIARPTVPEGPEQPATDDPLAGSAVNIVVLGTDDRSGENALLAGEDPGGGSDTTLIVHLPADRSRVDVVSIPRDSRAQIPACHLDYNPEGPVSRPQEAKFNKAFDIGWETGEPALAAACTMSTIQTMTGLTINAFVIVDMAGFAQMVDAVGGVRVCVPEPLRDTRYTGLDLAAGWHDLQGVQALQYVRARHIEGGDGLDPTRIERQQRFIGALLRRVLSSDVLTSPLALAGFLDAATQSLTVSSELGDATTQLGLAWSLRDLDATDITFLTVPWEFGSGGYVDWTEDAALVWSRLANDVPLNSAAQAPAAPTQPDPAQPDLAQPDPAQLDPAQPDPAQPAGPPGQPSVEPDLPVRSAEDPDEVLCG